MFPYNQRTPPPRVEMVLTPIPPHGRKQSAHRPDPLGKPHWMRIHLSWTRPDREALGPKNQNKRRQEGRKPQERGLCKRHGVSLGVEVGAESLKGKLHPKTHARNGQAVSVEGECPFELRSETGHEPSAVRHPGQPLS
jgi:hypothetical protein